MTNNGVIETGRWGSLGELPDKGVSHESLIGVPITREECQAKLEQQLNNSAGTVPKPDHVSEQKSVGINDDVMAKIEADLV